MTKYDAYKSNFHDKIIRILKATGYSEQTLSDKSGLSLRVIQQYITGARYNPSRETLLKLVQNIKVDPDFLLNKNRTSVFKENR